MKVGELAALLETMDSKLPVLILGEDTDFFYGELEESMISVDRHCKTGMGIWFTYRQMEKSFPILRIGIKDV